MPLLTIITRTFGGRPLGLERCTKSIADQTDRDVQHLLALDDQRRGVGWSHINLRTLSDRIAGDYVMLLDDDDYLIDSGFVKALRSHVAEAPEVVIVKMDMGNGAILPPWRVEPPAHSSIASTCIISRSDIWREHVADFTDQYDGDYAYTIAVWNCGHPFTWLDRVVAKVGRVSHGAGEDGHPPAVV